VRLYALWILVATASGCGRIGFGALGDAGGIGDDSDGIGDGTGADAAISVVLVSDDFMRTVANDLGNADVGGTWQIFNPNGATVGVTVDHAFFTMPSANMYADCHVAGTTALDSETRVVASFDRLPPSDGYYLYPAIRVVGAGSGYQLVAALQSNGDVLLKFNRDVSNTNTDLTSYVTTLTGITANDRFALSLRGLGASPTTLCGRIWRDGSPEPDVCTITAQDSAPILQAPGLSYLSVQDGVSGAATTASFTAFRFLRVGPE
jgi:hypothetical protein